MISNLVEAESGGEEKSFSSGGLIDKTDFEGEEEEVSEDLEEFDSADEERPEVTASKFFNSLPSSSIEKITSPKNSVDFFSSESSSSTSEMSNDLSNLPSSISNSQTSLTMDHSHPYSCPPYEVPIPSKFRQGINLLKITHKKIQKKTFWLKPEEGKLVWESGSLRRPNGTTTLRLENIRDIRVGALARPPSSTFRISLTPDQLSLCMCITYTDPNPAFSSSNKNNYYPTSSTAGKVRTLYTIGLERDIWKTWKDNLLGLWSGWKMLRGGASGSEGSSACQSGMIGNGNFFGDNSEVKSEDMHDSLTVTKTNDLESHKQKVWDVMSWKMADDDRNNPKKSRSGSNSNSSLSLLPSPSLAGSVGHDRTLNLSEIKLMCLRLGITVSQEQIESHFKAVDNTKRGSLDFAEFQKFVQKLKRRPDIEIIFDQIRAGKDGISAIQFFEFMKQTQKSNLSKSEIFEIFSKYSSPPTHSNATTPTCSKSANSLKIPQLTPSPTTSVEDLLTPFPGCSSSPRFAHPSLPGGNINISGNENSSGHARGESASSAPSGKPVSRRMEMIQHICRRSIKLSDPSKLFLFTSSNPPCFLVEECKKDGEREKEKIPNGVMGLDEFTSFLLSSFNSPFDEEFYRLKAEELNRPLCEYYISSSHNTYLIGGQLKGESTVEGYIRALQQGCRSVELDCWDGPTEPVIYHGHTLTSKISARDVLNAISTYAFVASPYPLILSVEVHCSISQQEKLAKIFRECLGPALVDNFMFGEQEVEKLPSPEDLKWKILIKAKNKGVSGYGKGKDELDEALDFDETNTESSDIKRVFNGIFRRDRSHSSERQENFIRSIARRSSSSSSSSDRPSVFADEDANILASSPSRSSSFPRTSRHNSFPSSSIKPVMAPVLSSLLVYTIGVVNRGIGKDIHYAANHVISMGEKRLNKQLKEREGKMEIRRHCEGRLIRSYPAGTRIMSGNYNPIGFWEAGIQLVAMNWQTFDIGMEINSAFFERNGRCGYILKPESLRSGKKGGFNEVVKYTLEISIISAQRLPRPSSSFSNDSHLNPFVQLSILTSSTQSQPLKRRTRTIKRNGFNPTWNESFSIDFQMNEGVVGEGMGFLRIEVGEEREGIVSGGVEGGGEKTVGRWCVCLDGLKSGYRHIPLYDQFGDQYLFSTLFIKTNLIRHR